MNDGLESALKQARDSAGGRDIRISGGANVVQQFLNAGLVDEFTLHYSPVFFGEGTPLLAGIDDRGKVKVRDGFVSKGVTHVTYELLKPTSREKSTEPDLMAAA